MNLNNPCDPGSKDYLIANFISLISGEKKSLCGIANPSATPNDQKEITSFSFDSITNGISKNYTGTITETNITLNVPYAMRSNVIASFSTTGEQVLVGEVLQISGTTVNSFTSPRSYTVVAKDKTTKAFVVTVKSIVPLNDTGQTSCWDSTPTLLGSCSGIGHDGSYINVPNARFYSTPASTTNFPSDFTTKDQLTGLLWKSCSEGQTGSGCIGGVITHTFSQAFNACISLNSLNSGSGFSGKANWRLPTIQELTRLVNYQNPSPTIDTASFPGTTGFGYWSSIPNAANTANSWGVDFLNGTTVDFAIGASRNVRCVSGDPPPNADFTDTGDGTVTDNITSLIWQKCSDGRSGSSCATGATANPLWSVALTTCTGASTASKTWRLPYAIELQSILDYSQASFPMIHSVFPNTALDQYWSSTSLASTPVTCLLAYFNGGSLTNLSKGNTRPIRCVAN